MVVKHNNALPDTHYLRNWQRRNIHTWFHQSAQKTARRYKRSEKLAREAPRPIGLLRPIVHPPTRRHNMKTRPGRGFSIDELKKAGLSRRVAPTIGIAVDLRRRNKSAESLEQNVLRLKEYLSKLVVFPRKTKLRKGFGGVPDDTSKSQLAKYQSVAIAKVMPIAPLSTEIQAVAIAANDREFDAFATLKKARYEGRKNYKKVRMQELQKKMYDERVARREGKA